MLSDTDTLLCDHAHCEKKAAGSDVSDQPEGVAARLEVLSAFELDLVENGPIRCAMR